MPLSTILANIQLQLQDAINPNLVPVNRILPQYVYPTTITQGYSAYYVLGPNSTTNLVTGSSFFAFLFIKNVTPGGQPAAIFTVFFDDLQTATVNQVTLGPGALLMLANPNVIQPGAPIPPYSAAQAKVPTSGLSCVAEVFYGL